MRTTPGGAALGVRLVFAASIVAVAPLSLREGFRLQDSLAANTLPAALLGLLAGALAADLVSGLVHWACDTWGNERTRWLGPGLIRSFREHHHDPRAMLAHDWIEVNGEVAAAASAAFLGLSLPAVQALLLGQPFLHAFAWSAISVAALANQLHQWSHTASPPAAVRALQNRGFLLSPVRHRVHHRAPHSRGYCIATGWLNGILDATGFWRALEHLVHFATGATPRQGDRDAAAATTGASLGAARRGRSLGSQ